MTYYIYNASPLF